VAGVDRQAYRRTRIGQEGFQVFGTFNDRAQMVVVGELQALTLDVVGHLGQARAELLPALGVEARGSRQGRGAVAVDGVAGLGVDEHRRAHRLQQGQVLLQRRDLVVGRLHQQVAAVPAAH
jgi:hypothetical protein